MKGLKVGYTYSKRYRVPENKTVPNLLPELVEFRRGQPVLATGFMVGIIESPCMAALYDFLEEGEACVGTKLIDFDHCAATLPNTLLIVDAKCIDIHGTYSEWDVVAYDEEGVVAAKGKHGRRVIQVERFLNGVQSRAKRIMAVR